MQHHGNLSRAVAAPAQIRGQQVLFDVAIAVPVTPVAQVAVAEFVAKQRKDAVLGGAFRFADVTHTSRTLPVSSSCIMPCLSARVLSRRCSSAVSSASMSDSTSVIAACSFSGGSF